MDLRFTERVRAQRKKIISSCHESCPKPITRAVRPSYVVCVRTEKKRKSRSFFASESRIRCCCCNHNGFEGSNKCCCCCRSRVDTENKKTHHFRHAREKKEFFSLSKTQFLWRSVRGFISIVQRTKGLCMSQYTYKDVFNACAAICELIRFSMILDVRTMPMIMSANRSENKSQFIFLERILFIFLMCYYATIMLVNFLTIVKTCKTFDHSTTL